MKYDEVVESLMKESNIGADEPLLIYRADGEWNMRYIYGEDGKPFD
jgi:hypothetical protein